MRHFLLRDELGSSVKVPLLTKLNMIRRGFLSASSVLYDLDKYSLDDYLSDLASVRMCRVNNQHNPRAHYPVGLDNKLFFSSLMEDIIRVPKVYAFVSKGIIHPFHREGMNLHVDTLAEFCDRVGGTLVFKRIVGGGGKGIYFLHMIDGRLHLDSQPIDDEGVQQWLHSLDEYFINEFIRQCDFPAQLFPRTTNTIRIVTMLDPESNQAFIPIAVHRVGRDASYPVDNWSSGGLSIEIDLETGELGAATYYPGGMRKLVWHERHPDTGAPLKGELVPRWKTICDDVLAAANRLPFYRIVGWDIVLTDDGIVAVEANGTSDVDLLQVHRPLLRDPRVRAFFKHHGTIR